jgi:succinate-acetate transporter protein
MPFCFQDENCFLHDYGTFTIMVHLSTKMIGKALILIFFNIQATFIIFQVY